MGRTKKSLYIEENILSSINSLHTDLSKNYKVSESDIVNEALSYGIPLVRMRRQIGNDQFHELFKKLTKQKENGDKHDK